MRRLRRLVIGVGLALSCAATAGAQTKVTMHLDFLVNGYHAPFYVAQDKGWYKEAGLDVTIDPGKGSGDSIKTVGVGSAEFGFPDYGLVAKSVSEGVPITAVAAFVHDTPAVVVSFADHPVNVPKDLEGKTVSVLPFGASVVMLPAFVKLNGIDMSKVKTIAYSFGALVPSFLTGKVDAAVGYYFGECLAARYESPSRKIVCLRFADYGVKAYANGIVVNNDFLAKNPAAVAAFVGTSLRALEYTFKHVDEAAALTATHTETPKATLKDQLTLAIDLMDTTEARKAHYGVMTAEKWASTQKLQLEYGGQQRAVPDAELWTNKFIQ
jgi:NitT/TauT family transport system substrate-binding protein